MGLVNTVDSPLNSDPEVLDKPVPLTFFFAVVFVEVVTTAGLVVMGATKGDSFSILLSKNATSFSS